MRHTLPRQPAITILLISLLSPGLAAAMTTRPEDPRPVLQLPYLNPEHLNPCDPRGVGQERSPISSPIFTSVKLGQADTDNLFPHVMSDMLGVQAVCEDLVFVPGQPIDQADGSLAVVFHNKADSTDASVSIAYFVRQGILLRLSMWVSAEGDLDSSYAQFHRMIAGQSGSTQPSN